MDELNQADTEVFNTLYKITHKEKSYEEGKHALTEIKNLNVRDGRYTLNGHKMEFTTNKGYLVLTAEDAIEIAYTLFDWAGMPYDQIENIEDRREKGEL